MDDLTPMSILAAEIGLDGLKERKVGAGGVSTVKQNVINGEGIVKSGC